MTDQDTDQEYTVEYEDGISLHVQNGKLTIKKGDDTDTTLSDLSDVSTDIQGESQIYYHLKGLNLWDEEIIGSEVPPKFPTSATCNAVVPPNLKAKTNVASYVIVVLVFAAVAAVIFLLLYRGQNRHLLKAKTWLVGKKAAAAASG